MKTRRCSPIRRRVWNPTMFHIFNKQATPKIIVGDPHQQIYGFRGAINALDHVESTHVLKLTQSFRFGPEIAFAANCILMQSHR